MKKSIIDLKNDSNRTLMKRSIVIQSASALTLHEQSFYNLFQYLLHTSYKKSFAKVLAVSLSHIKKHLSSNSKRLTEKEIYKMLKDMHSKSIYFDVLGNEEDYAVKTDLKKGKYLMHLIGDIKIIEDEAKGNNEKLVYIGIPDLLHEVIKNEVKETDQNTPVLLEVVRQSKNKYTSKLYEFISSYANLTGKTRWGYDPTIKAITIQSFRNMMGLTEENKYKDISDLKKRVLDPVVKECAEKFGLFFSYDLIKDRRKVVEIKFTFSVEERKKFQKKMEERTWTKKDIASDSIVKESRLHAQKESVKFFQDQFLMSSKIKDVLANEDHVLLFDLVLEKNKIYTVSFDEISDYIRYKKEIQIASKMKEQGEVGTSITKPELLHIFEETPTFDLELASKGFYGQVSCS